MRYVPNKPVWKLLNLLFQFKYLWVDIFLDVSFLKHYNDRKLFTCLMQQHQSSKLLLFDIILLKCEVFNILIISKCLHLIIIHILINPIKKHARGARELLLLYSFQEFFQSQYYLTSIKGKVLQFSKEKFVPSGQTK